MLQPAPSQTGTIINILPNGLYISLGDNKIGFVQRRELSWDEPRISPLLHYQEGQTVKVVQIEQSGSRANTYSVKRAEHDPWLENLHRYRSAIQPRHEMVVRGVVANLDDDCVYLNLSDHNDAMIRRRNISDEERIDIHQVFAIGDHVEARVSELVESSRKIILDLKGHISAVGIKRRNDAGNTRSLSIPISKKFPQLHYAVPSHREPSPCQPKPEAEPLAHLKVMVIENDPIDREFLVNLLRDVGITAVVPGEEILTDAKQILAHPGEIDVLFLDKHLDKDSTFANGCDLIDPIMQRWPDVRIYLTTAEPLETLQGKPYLAKIRRILLKQRRLSPPEVLRALSETAGTALSSSAIEVMKLVDEQAQAVRNFIGDSSPLEEQLPLLLQILCGSGQGGVRAVILKMDQVTEEVFCVSQYGCDDVSWEEYKSRLRHTPVSNVIGDEETFFTEDLPATRKKHLPPQFAPSSFAGIPIHTFAESNHGLFLFGDTPGAISQNLYKLSQDAGLVIGRILERQLIDEVMGKEAYLANVGRLHLAMGHEIRNALVAAEGVTENLSSLFTNERAKGAAEKANMDVFLDQGIELVEKIKAASQVMFSHFDFYADLFKTEASKQQINLRDLLKELLETTKPLRPGSTIVDLQVDRGLAMIGSELKLKQVLKNLLINASQQLKIHQPATPYLGMHVVEDPASARLPIKIEISDSGPGIHGKDFENIFEPFVSTRKSGAGLGLYICRILTRAMGGRISVKESFIQLGTTFLLELPRS